MIIEFSEKTLVEIRNNSSSLSLPLVMDNIATMLRKGDNIFKIDIPTLDHILTNVPIRKESKQTLSTYKSTLRYYDKVDDLQDFIAVICFTYKSVKLCRENSLLLEVPLEFVRDGLYLSKPKLIFEDYYDIDFITMMSKILFIKANQVHIHTGFEAIHGGGIRTGETLQRHARLNSQFCLVFADSDKKAPYLGNGDTLNEIISSTQILIENGFNNFHVETIDVHEIENIIPFYFIERLYGKEPDCQYRLENLKKLFAYNTEYRHYFDFKKGISCDLVRKELNMSGREKFWILACNELGIFQPNVELFYDACNDSKSVLHGYPNFLRRTIDVINENFYKLIEEIELDEFESERWNRIQRIISSVCCTTKKTRS